jgi:hypothetical protein
LTSLQYAEKLYGPETTSGLAEDGNPDAEEDDIEAEIKKELADIRTPSEIPLFKSIMLDTQCCMIDQPPFRVLMLILSSDILQNTFTGRTSGIR